MLQFITHRNDRFADEVAGVEKVLQGGCRWVQLRMKDASVQQIMKQGRLVAGLCRSYGAKFILDDRVELVETLGADGVHLGKNDMPVPEARALLGPDKIIGATANSFDDIKRAVADGADYIGLGPFRFTTTKAKLSPVLGLEGYAAIMQKCRREGINIPIVAIGGILANDMAQIMATGVSGVAVSGAILNAADPVAETKKFL